MGAEIVDALLKYGTSPGVVLLFLLWQEQRRKRNGGVSVEKLNSALQEAMGKALAIQREAMRQHLDIIITEHFDQLRRDLETKIGNEHKTTRDDWTNALSRFMLELELFITNPKGPLRRRGER